jgi:RNA polymerase-binding protein DksA
MAKKAKRKPAAKTAKARAATRKRSTGGTAASKKPTKKAARASVRKPAKKKPVKKAAKKKAPRKAATKKTVRKAAPKRAAGARKTAGRTAKRVAVKPKRPAKAADASAGRSRSTPSRNRPASSRKGAAGGASTEKPKPRRRIKSPYTRRSLAPMRAALLEMRSRLLGDMNLMGQEALRADDSDVDAENVADHGTDAFERHMTLNLMENEARTLRQINEALETMAKGRYGVCGECEKPIPLARLEVLPYARTCVRCQEAAERLG